MGALPFILLRCRGRACPARRFPASTCFPKRQRGSGPKDWPSLRGLRGFGTFPQAPLSLTFFEKKVSKEAFNISTKKHLLAGHTHTGQQVLLFTI